MKLSRLMFLLAAMLPLFVAALALSADPAETKRALEADATGWKELLSSKDLKEWKRVPIPPTGKLKDKNPWKVSEDGKTLFCEGAGAGHEMLLYNEEFADGIFHVEWKFKKLEDGKGYNSGVYVRNSADGAVWHQAQVGSKNVGGLFGSTLMDGKAARFSHSDKVAQRGKEAGEWNTFELTCKGKTVKLWVNGAVTATWDKCEVPKGYLGVEAEGFHIEFKNLKFKEMK